jgi:tRNA (mo5U34)-methyltransferase
MIHYQQFSQDISRSKVAPWHDYFLNAVQAKYESYTHGEALEWQNLLESLPEIAVKSIDITKSVSVSSNAPLSAKLSSQLVDQLMQLHPWRKGPFELFGINIDTEWRSDWKWDRIIPHITPLKDRSVLDVGCGNGYHCWRMLGEEARFVLGIDPSQKFLAQFAIMQKYISLPGCHLLPLGIEDMPEEMGNNAFDSIFCMGVLYHRKSPINLLYQLKNLLNKGGELILETLVVDGDQNTALVPSSRYAQMRNVWFLPSTQALELWLSKCGFTNVKTIDISQTSIQEQRATPWMTFHSLENFLDTKDNNKTVEGYPAPKRATIVANR